MTHTHVLVLATQCRLMRATQCRLMRATFWVTLITVKCQLVILNSICKHAGSFVPESPHLTTCKLG